MLLLWECHLIMRALCLVLGVKTLSGSLTYHHDSKNLEQAALLKLLRALKNIINRHVFPLCFLQYRH